MKVEARVNAEPWQLRKVLISPMDTHTIPNVRMTVGEIARRLNIGRQTIYAMLEGGILPGIRLGQRWLITRHAYLEWERTCGMCDCSAAESGLQADTEVRS